ncbi:MAG: hypothetical protein ACJ0P3_07175 [Flavobacteriaceae bacterium]|mgnify:FL=1|jgi:hypothetical protein|tara:strand:- start:788 stop:1051 length:264 start_codon:yes stop_codon:yes gene_type:complete
MKYLIWILFIICTILIFLGLSIPDSDTLDQAIKAKEIELSNKLIGFGVLGMFFLVFPLFSYYRWKDKKMSDYVLNKENLDKMKEYNN